ncbi:class I SAM-dependent RNA methyltransferase [Geobacter hydrogenophilus]|uniref:RNA methyltransferase n=1 Tax=Geobacter hydrogenophilus TaxID=40983 RepID=A0A9W6G1B4_9BACT|nr:class I SAM-dependent RNA methyltransferase [Geobacter hydrogenophilus]MBT0893138.1 class I SAM-dependent RNA methyltransferase [Geobacter hydrogenophilus]GLI39020.1 putative RNA methyltransferase [Geobacter hydrogenophilus]
MTEAVVRIESLAFGGAGFGRVEGKACFVPFTAPDDLVRIRLSLVKNSYLEGEIVELLEASPRRVVPLCPVFGICGGCTWQHLSYDDQLEAKERIVGDTLWRFGRIESERVARAVPSDSPYGYRSRVQFKVRWTAGKLQMGFYRRGSHYVVDIPEGCAICNPALNQVLAEIRPVISCFAEPDRIPQVDVAVGDNGVTLAVVHYIGGNRDCARAHFTACRGDLPAVGGLHLQCGRKESIEPLWGDDALTYCFPAGFLPELPSMTLGFSRGGFSQVNYRQNRELLRAVHRMAGLTGEERLLDLFCGNGNFAIPLSRYAMAVVGIEDYGPSLEDAKRNAAANGTGRIEFIRSDAAAGVRQLVSREEHYSVVVLDPPRTGAKEAVAEVASLRPERVVYVSCDPATLGRDLGLFRKSGYNVRECLPVDMFPQTFHIESVTVLSRAD